MNSSPNPARLALLVPGVLLGFLLEVFSVPAPSATLQGTVRDAHGAAVPGATVQAQLGTKRIDTVHSDATGNYRVASLAAGAYTLRADSATVGMAAFGPFALQENETRSVDLVLRPSTASLDFSDEPKFTVAGVTDHTYVGGHGSDTVVRSAEELAKSTASLAQPGASKAATAERQGKPLDAVREYQRAAELDPSETNLFAWGTELLMHRAPQPAVEVFTKGIRLYPRSSRMLLGAAVSLYAKGDYQQAARRFYQAADLNPSDPNPYLFLGKVESPEITESTTFLDLLARFVQLQPDNPWANYYYAINLWKLRKNPEDTETSSRVQSLLEKAVRLDPTLGAAYLQLGILCSEKHDLPAAIGAYRKAIEVEPQLEQAHYRLAQAYRQTGEAQKARREIEAFHQLAKSSAQALERERSELQQFVINLKSPAPTQ